MEESEATALSEPARQVHRWIRKTGVAEFSERDIYASLRGAKRFKEVAAVQAALYTLASMGWVQRLPDPERPAGQPGRPPSPRWIVNPHNDPFNPQSGAVGA